MTGPVEPVEPAARERANRLRPIYLTLLGLCVLFALNVSVSAWSVGRIGQAADDNCARIHKVTMTLDEMIASSRKSLESYLADGTITAAQLHRELDRIKTQRAKLAGADCPSREIRAAN